MITRAEPIAPTAPRTLVERVRQFTDAMRPIWAVCAALDDTRRAGIYDLELVMRLLNLPEFAEWLRTHGDDTQSAFGDEIGELIGELEAATGELEAVGDELQPSADQSLAASAAEAVTKADTLDDVRTVLVETGALAADDTQTDVPSLLRALLS